LLPDLENFTKTEFLHHDNANPGIPGRMAKDDDEALRRRFESHLPKYGTLWKSMAPKKSFLSAIEAKTTVSLNVRNSVECPFDGCNEGPCAAPTYDEDVFATPYGSEESDRQTNSPNVSLASSTASASRLTSVAIDFSSLRIHNTLNETPKSKTETLLINSEVSEKEIKEDLPGKSVDSSSSFSSGGDTVVVFDLSHLVHEENEDEVSKNSTSKGMWPNQLIVSGDDDDHSFEHIQAETDFGGNMSQESAGSVNDDTSDSSDGCTIIRFDISHLQDQSLSEQRDDDDDFEMLHPSLSSLYKVGEEQLVDTPTSTGSQHHVAKVDPYNAASSITDKKMTHKEDVKCIGAEVSWLVEDDEDDDESWVRPKVSSKHVEILSDSESESEWNDLFQEEPSNKVEDEEGRQKPENTIIILSDDESSFSDNDAIPVKQSASTQPSKGYFRKNRDRLTDEVFAEFNSLAFDLQLSAVAVSWSTKLRTTAGITRCTKDKANPQRRFASIELSVKVIDEHHRLRHTLLHEMCHAAQWLLDGKINPPHGSCFKKWANHAMAKVKGAIVTTTHDYAIQYKYAWACSTKKCGAVFQRQSKSIDVDKQVCGKCKGRLIEINVPKKGENKAYIDRTPKKQKALSGYALFVKEHSSQVRSRIALDRMITGSTTTVSQAEVMKECAILWHEWKKSSRPDSEPSSD
jgi:predicted SprT family Zn-dependent metalloprotease